MFFKKIIQAFSNKFVQKGVTYLPVLLQLLPTNYKSGASSIAIHGSSCLSSLKS